VREIVPDRVTEGERVADLPSVGVPSDNDGEADAVLVFSCVTVRLAEIDLVSEIVIDRVTDDEIVVDTVPFEIDSSVDKVNGGDGYVLDRDGRVNEAVREIDIRRVFVGGCEMEGDIVTVASNEPVRRVSVI